VDTIQTPTSEAPKETWLSHLGKFTAALGAVSALALAVATLSAWAFGRGMLSVLQFPAYTISPQVALETFAGVAEQYTGAFLLALGVGFFVPLPRRPRIREALAWGTMPALFCVVLPTSLWENHWLGVRILLILAALVGPLALAVVYRLGNGSPIRTMACVLLTLVVLMVQETHLYEFGREKANALMTSGDNDPGTDRGLAAFKMRDSPKATLTTDSRLPLRIAPAIRNGLFVYEPPKGQFLRVVFETKESYFLIEHTAQSIARYSISKSAVKMLRFEE